MPKSDIAERPKSLDEQLNEAVRFVRSRTKFNPRIGLVLGSGLGDFAQTVNVEQSVDAAEIPFYPRGGVKGHAGKLIFGTIQNVSRQSAPLLLFQGRVHFYEIGDIERVIFPIRLAASLGVRTLLLTNAAGGINEKYESGQLMLIKGYLNLARQYPTTDQRELRNAKAKADLDCGLQEVFRESARDVGIRLQEGVYCWLHGPSYETAAEIRMLRILGADAVGMSTVPEIVQAQSQGMKVAAISLISNMATGLSTTKLSHQEVTETANRLQESFTALMRNVILRIR